MAFVKLENVSVVFRRVSKTSRLFPPVLHMGNTGMVPEFSLSNINISLKSGDRLGVLGRNGAGKTTLLKVLAGILKPINGDVLMGGSVGSLFGPVPFVNPILSGHANTLLFAQLNNLNKNQSHALVEKVREFIDIGEYFLSPVHTYSAGMGARLNFALLTAIGREILIMDEMIGAGDVFFAKKINQRLKEIYDNSEIMVLASHSNDLIRELCNVCLVLENGSITHFGEVNYCLEAYLKND